MECISDEQLRAFHKMDRQLYRRLVQNLSVQPNLAKETLAFCLYLEETGCPNVVKKLTDCSNSVLKSLVKEAHLCILYIHSNGDGTIERPINSSTPIFNGLLEFPINLAEPTAFACFHVQRILASTCRRIIDPHVFPRGEAQPSTSPKISLVSTRSSPISASHQHGVLRWRRPSPHQHGCPYHRHFHCRNRRRSTGAFYCSCSPHSLSSPKLYRGHGIPPLPNLKSKVQVSNYSKRRRELHVDDEILLNLATVPGQERTMFLTFSRGFPLEEQDLIDYFNRQFKQGVVERVIMRRVAFGVKPLFARIIFYSRKVVQFILKGVEKAKLLIRGKDVWARVYKRSRDL